MFHRSANKIDLPSAPIVLSRIIELTRSQDVDFERLADVVLCDQSLSAKVLRLANSAYFRRNKKVETVSDAVLTLGFGYVRNLAASASVLEALFPRHSYPGFSWLNLWTHCVTCAVASESIHAYMTGVSRRSDESAFVAGLLHDVGKLLLAQIYPKKFLQVVDTCRERQMEMIDSESYCMSMDHTRAGVALLEEWDFPDRLIAGVAYHHDPAYAPNNKEIALAVCAGNLLAKRLGEAYIAGADTNISLQGIACMTKLDMQDLGRIVSEVRDGVLRCSEIVCWGIDLPGWYPQAA